MTLKNNFLKIRLKLGFSRTKDFAKFLEVNKDQFSRYETNSSQPGPEVLLRVYKKIKTIEPNIHMEDLIYDDSERV